MMNGRKMTEIERKIHEQFTRYGRNAREWLRKCALLLPEIERKQIWRKKGFSSIYEYAAKIAGMSRTSVDEALRVLKKIEDKPELKKVVEIYGVQRVRPVASIATQETAEFWATKAIDMSKNTLEAYVREYKKEYQVEPACNFQPACGFLPREDLLEINSSDLTPQKIDIAMSLDFEVAQKLLKLKGAADWNTFMKNLLEEREEKLEQKKPEKIATKSRHIPVAIQKHVVEKTNSQCAFPGCTKSYEILHHTQRFELEKVHDPDRLAPLCKAHERIAHLGLIENEDEGPETWRIRQTHDPTDSKRHIDELVWLYR